MRESSETQTGQTVYLVKAFNVRGELMFTWERKTLQAAEALKAKKEAQPQWVRHSCYCQIETVTR